MDVNINPETKISSVPVTPTIEFEDATKPQVQPVPENSSGSDVKLSDQALHGQKGQTARERQELSREEIEEAAQEIQGRFEAMGSSFKFGLFNDREAESIVGQLRDKDTGEVVRQYPSEEVLALRAKLNDLVGLLFDEKA